MDISIVVAVYNVEKYLRRYLNSIFSQHLCGTFEVIAVNGASTDSSARTLETNLQREPRLAVISRQVNKGLSITRATAMKAALGEYVMHVDSDDWP